MDIILYHKNCPDGWCSAYIAKKRYPEAQLVAYDQGMEVPLDLVRGKDVLSVDIRWRNKVSILSAQLVAKSFKVIDHHASGEGEMDGLSNYIFDVKRSGATLTWDYLFGKDGGLGSNLLGGDARPWWVNYTEDRDLWKWQLQHSKEIAAAMHSYPQTEEAWNVLTTEDLNELIDQGEIMVEQEANYVRSLSKNHAKGFLGNTPVVISNAPYIFASELGHVLSNLYSFDGIHASITWYERIVGEDMIHFSLRGDGEVNIGALCKQFPGGGGHFNAGGFNLPVIEGRQLIDQILTRVPCSSLLSNRC